MDESGFIQYFYHLILQLKSEKLRFFSNTIILQRQS